MACVLMDRRIKDVWKCRRREWNWIHSGTSPLKECSQGQVSTNLVTPAGPEFAHDFFVPSRITVSGSPRMIRTRKLMLLNLYVCTFPWWNLITFCYFWGLTFISERFKEYWWPLNAFQLILSAEVTCGPPRYCLLRLEWWQLLYHQAPL